MRSRRLLLAILVVTLVLPAVASARVSPRTLARTASVDGGVVRPGLRIDFVGVHWRGPSEGAAIRLGHGRRWTPWRTLHRGDRHPPGRVASELVAVGGATAYEVRLPPGAQDGHAVAINTTDGPRSRPPASRPRRSGFPLRSAGRVCYRPRAAWGADESLRFEPGGTERWPPAFFPVQRLTVHHTATEAQGVDPAAVVQAIYRYHAHDLGFGDIGYHLLVDEAGCVYEGRHSGDDPLPVYASPALGTPPLAVNGGHVAGFNAGNVGVAVLGEFTHRAPSRAARRSLTLTLAALAAISNLEPLGHGSYVNPITGATKDTSTISGHRDWLPTECPGAELYARLPAVRLSVARLLAYLPIDAKREPNPPR